MDVSIPVNRLLQFVRNVVYWSLGEGESSSGSVWDMGKEILSAVVMIQKFMNAEGSQGDSFWKRNIGVLRCIGQVREVVVQLHLVQFLLTAQSRHAKEAAEIDPAIIEEIRSVLQQLMEGVSEGLQVATELLSKLDSLSNSMNQDGFAGVPDMCVENDTRPPSYHHISCIDNSPLWNAVQQLKGETHMLYSSIVESTQFLKHFNATCKPLSSPLDALLTHGDLSQRSVFLSNAVDLSSERGSVLSRLHHLIQDIQIILSSDYFVTGIINPLNEHPVLPSPQLSVLSQQMKAQMESSVESSVTHQIHKLEEAVEKATSRADHLERDVIDLTRARDQLSEQLSAKKDSVDMRVTTADDESRLQQALDRKRGEVKQLTRETAQLKKEVQELRNRPEQRPREDVSSEKYRLMKRLDMERGVSHRSVQKAAAKYIQNQLSFVELEDTAVEKVEPLVDVKYVIRSVVRVDLLCCYKQPA